MADRLQAPLTSTLEKRKRGNDSGKQNAMEHETAVQRGNQRARVEKAEDESRKVEGEKEEVKVKGEIVQKVVNMFTISDVEIEMSALSYLAARRREN